MRVAICVFVLAAAVAASPFLDADATITAPASLPSNGTHHRHNGTHNPHREPTPTFKQECNCPAPIIPVDQLSAAQKCEFQYAHNMACFYRAQGGCPSPTLAC
ncbi:hypothetical protein K491DRAFT_696658 [Lophiostoma macrostomum CBS 122681]|uniref:Uncharacterized protein n=1 Tax=Lophiostoma macrostomum CBS 122681 TaxID=1314788 RepID=A0A6A6STU2_9PLEO|nr:hypothetical protein K491DRAFT_696658 [Lophiostoma macrostomum CBS 122681]